MIADSSIRPSKLLRQARAGDADAVGRLLEWYLHYLKILASAQLDQKRLVGDGREQGKRRDNLAAAVSLAVFVPIVEPGIQLRLISPVEA